MATDTRYQHYNDSRDSRAVGWLVAVMIALAIAYAAYAFYGRSDTTDRMPYNQAEMTETAPATTTVR